MSNKNCSTIYVYVINRSSYEIDIMHKMGKGWSTNYDLSISNLENCKSERSSEETNITHSERHIEGTSADNFLS